MESRTRYEIVCLPQTLTAVEAVLDEAWEMWNNAFCKQVVIYQIVESQFRSESSWEGPRVKAHNLQGRRTSESSSNTEKLLEALELEGLHPSPSPAEPKVHKDRERKTIELLKKVLERQLWNALGSQGPEATTSPLSGTQKDTSNKETLQADGSKKESNIQDLSHSLGGSEFNDFDDDDHWCEDYSEGAPTRESPSVTCPSMEPPGEPVSSLVRSFFGVRKKRMVASEQTNGMEANANVKTRPKRVLGTTETEVHEEHEDILSKKVEALEAEIFCFKKENKRLERLAKENEESLVRLAREKAEWEHQKETHLQALRADQEEQMQKLKKEKQMLETRSRAMLGPPAVQRKEVDELKERLAREQDEHHDKERRWRLTALRISSREGNLQTSRLRRMNEDLTRQMQELREEIKRYERQLLADWDAREIRVEVSRVSTSKNLVPNDERIPTKELEDNTVSKSAPSGYSLYQENSEPTDGSAKGLKASKVKYEVGLLTEQAKLLSQLYSHPWGMDTDCTSKEQGKPKRVLLGHQNPNFTEWR